MFVHDYDADEFRFYRSLHERQVANTGGGISPELIDPWAPIQLEWQTVTISGNAVDLPVIRSAGVDLVYGTNDDIVSIDGNGIFA